MTPVSHEQSLAAEDEGGGLPKTNDMYKKREATPVEEEDPEETEDEEVKVNCIGGFAGVQHSDMSSDEESDDDDPDEDEEEMDGESENSRPLHFVSSQQSAGGNIQRPRAILANSPSRSPQDVEERDDEDDVSSMDESSDDDGEDDEASSDGAREIGMSIEATNFYESDAEDSLSEASSNYNEAPSSAGGIAGSDSERDVSDEEEEEEQDEELEDDSEEEGVESEAEEEAEDEEMSDDESAVSVPFDTFKNVDGPSDVLELESALQDTKNVNADEASVASDDSAMEDLQDPTLQSALLCDIVELDPKKNSAKTLAHVKRVLSSSALLGRSSSSTMLSPKRICRAAGSDTSNSDDDALPSELSLGPSAFSTSQKVSVSDEDDEEQDRQLGEELKDGEAAREGETTPIPLLTPPGSPLRVESNEGDVTVCEWPSNLAVDSAMTATRGLRPPSPQNLQEWELEEEERLMKSDASPKPPPREDSFSSSLTPMMRGISVEPDAPFLCL